MDTSSAGSTLLRWTSRLTLAALILTLPGFDFHLACAAAVKNTPNLAGRRATSAPRLRTPSASSTPAPLAPLSSRIAPATGRTAPQSRAPGSALRGLAAADGFSRSLNSPGRSESGLRSAAGRPFEGWGLRRADSSAVLATPGLGLRALAAGPNQGGGPGSGRGPSAGPSPSKELVDRAEAVLKTVLDPGTIVEEQAERLLTAELGIADRPTLAGILAELAARGRLASIPNSSFSYMYTNLADEAENDKADPALKEASLIALNAVRLNNESSKESHSKALYFFEKASVDYKAFQGKQGTLPSGYDHVFALRNNAALVLLQDHLIESQANLGKIENPDEDDAKSLKLHGKALAWIARTYFSKDHFPRMPDASLHAWLGKFVASAGAPAGQAAADGHKVLKTFVRDMGALDAAPRGAVSEAAKKFPLIGEGDKRYETLNELGRNLTGAAVRGELDPLIGRRKEIRQMLKVLLRRKKNNPVLVGEAGVGKSAIVEGLAQMVVNGEIPELAGVNIFQIDVTSIISDTKYVGTLEKKMKALFEELQAATRSKVILFLDEIHRIVGAGSSEKDDNDLSNILKVSLAGGQIAVMGATTLDEYRKIEGDAALDRRFQPVQVAAPSNEEAVSIVLGIKAAYEKSHGVAIPEETVRAAVSSASRYITARQLPDSAIDLLDDAASEVQLQVSEGRPLREVTPQDVAFEISLRTGIPAGQVSAGDLELINGLSELLNRRVVGQSEAVDKFVRAYRRARLGYRDRSKPMRFVLLGPTGSGKTHFARTVTGHVYGSEDRLIRLDMSGFMEKESVNRLIGPPPGYVGFEESMGELTEPVRLQPYSSVLLDEIDKAHPDVLKVLLQIFDYGFLRDSKGRKVDFRHATFFLTGNTGGSRADRSDRPMKTIRGLSPLALEDAESGHKDSYVEAFEDATLPELVGRIGKRNIIPFNKHDRGMLTQILGLELAKLSARLKDKRMTLSLSAQAEKRLLDIASSPENINYGARPLEDAVGDEIEDALAGAEAAGTIADGDSVFVDFKDGAWVVSRK